MARGLEKAQKAHMSRINFGPPSKAQVKKERYVDEVSNSTGKYSTDSEEDEPADKGKELDDNEDDDDEDDDGEEEEVEVEEDDEDEDDEDDEDDETVLEPVPRRATPFKVQKLKAALAISSSSKKKSKALERVKAMDLGLASPKGSPKGSPKSRKSTTPNKLKDVPPGFFSPRASSSSARKGTPKTSGKTPRKAAAVASPRPVIDQNRSDNVRVVVNRTDKKGQRQTKVYTSVPRNTEVSQLVFNLPMEWTTRRTDVYSVNGVVINNLEKTLPEVGLEDGGEIESFPRGTSG